jgi:hypothetical protein
MTSPISLSALSMLSIARSRFRRASSWPAPLVVGAGIAFGAGLVLLVQRWRVRNREEAAVRDRGPVTPATAPTTPADAPIGAPGRNLEDRLDEALEESFPASDPVSVHIE